MIQFDEHIFQMGWNHQLANFKLFFPFLSGSFGRERERERQTVQSLQFHILFPWQKIYCNFLMIWDDIRISEIILVENHNASYNFL